MLLILVTALLGSLCHTGHGESVEDVQCDMDKILINFASKICFLPSAAAIPFHN